MSMSINGKLLHPVSHWINFLNDANAVQQLFRQIYGDDETLLHQRRQAYLKVVERAAQSWGLQRNMLISRAPARLNLMGRHIDHRGGAVNPVALSVEVISAVAPRDDDVVTAHNLDEQLYPPAQFTISESLPPRKLNSVEEWDKWTMQEWLKRRAQGLERHWINYIRAAVVAFQERYRSTDGALNPQLCGMDFIVYGDVPPSAGLASSSSVFMVTAEAIVALNGLSMTDEEFVQACGYGEWYVGTRGGCGDHAAMHYGRRGQVCHIELHPFRISYCPFPTGHSIVAFNSFETAHKAGNARDIFNQRVACYEFGLMLIQTRHPDLRERLIYFRDINPNVVGDTATVYQLLRELPQRASLDEVKQLLPYEMHERVIQIASQHSPPKDGYPIRGVCLFGVAECERSNRCTVLLSDGRVNEFGELMNISHDGDRVAKLGDDGEMHTYASPCDDEHLQKLIASIHSDSSALRESAQLWRQPGSYRCSTPAIDFMVDVALSVDGVIGAQISGAGLGGCIMVLVRTDAVERLISAMTEYYYEPRSYEPCYVVGVPIAGSGVLTLN